MDNGSPEGLVIDNPQDGLFRVNRRAFTDPHILEWERERVFAQCWLYAGHESEIPTPGDFRACERGRVTSDVSNRDYYHRR